MPLSNSHKINFSCLPEIYFCPPSHAILAPGLLHVISKLVNNDLILMFLTFAARVLMIICLHALCSKGYQSKRATGTATKKKLLVRIQLENNFFALLVLIGCRLGGSFLGFRAFRSESIQMIKLKTNFVCLSHSKSRPHETAIK